jgi:hypothetical protein
MEEFQVSEEVVNLTVTLFVVGFGVGESNLIIAQDAVS